MRFDSSPDSFMKYTAEQFVLAMQMTYISICHIRERCLDSIMVHSGHTWTKDGTITYQSYPDSTGKDKFKENLKLVIRGQNADLESLMKRHSEEISQKYLADNPGIEKVLPNLREDMQKRWAEDREVATRFYLTRHHTTSDYSIISSIPDNVRSDYLQLCIEYLDTIINTAKTDFDEFTILSKKDREAEQHRKQKTKEDRKKETEFVASLLGVAPPTDEKRKKDMEEWERNYSPRARARQANQQNTEAIEAAKILRERVRVRFGK